jgi:probable DNA metabolism protein
MNQPALALTAYTVELATQIDFDGWRMAARRLALENVVPSDVEWTVSETVPPPLTPPRKGEGNASALPPSSLPPCREGLGVEVKSTGRHTPETIFRVPRAFVEAAQTAILHADAERFAFLYGVLWRLRSEANLMQIASDPDIRKLEAMQKAIRRDIHKMRAFVRFREVDGRFFSWFEPTHYIVERNAEFFVRRFTGMVWSIFTPYRSAHWDGEALSFGPGAEKQDVPAEDAAEDLWRTYYRNIFNPARLKVKAMQAEMPKKYWRNLPEAALIPELVRGADQAAREMIERMPTLPAPHHDRIQARHWPISAAGQDEGPAGKTLTELAKQAATCRRCPLWRDATQTVFGAGPEGAKIVFVGEQPGDQEDIQGKPFVGPAGVVFDAVLEEAEIDRHKTYVTNAVKHFKFEPRGKRRIHSKPNTGEVQACRWWLDHELGLIKPDLVVALGATAAQSLLGKAVPITKMRGQVIERDDGLKVFLTIHPSFILRIREEPEKRAERERFLTEMQAN